MYQQEIKGKKRSKIHDENIRKQICNQISDKTEIINRLRKEVLLCEDIKTRIPKMKENIEQQKMEEKNQKELENNIKQRKEKRL